MSNQNSIFSGLLRPYWSKQHGAWLTLITCWIIAIALSKPVFAGLFHQFMVLILLLSGLNLGELLIEKLKRKSPLPKNKQLWLLLYALLTVAAAISVFSDHTLWFLLPLLTTGGAIFILLSLKRMQKSIIAEWITFALFSLAGLLAYKSVPPPDLTVIEGLALLMSIYFGMSIFNVKARLNKVSPYASMIYAVMASFFLGALYGLTNLTISISLLLICKAFPVIAMPAWYGQLKIKHIGMMEMGFHLIFASILILLF